jgi:1-deoxy-D-xylulose-5-phosphate synthase
MPGGKSIIKFGTKWKQETKDFFVSSSLFEKFGIRYIGPIDGHDQKQVEHYLEFAKNAEQPVLLHILTEKGRGYDVAIENPERFHGASPFDLETGKGVPTALWHSAQVSGRDGRDTRQTSTCGPKRCGHHCLPCPLAQG